MQTTTYPLILFLLAIGVLLYGIIKLKINPFLVLLTVGIFTGLASGLPITKVTKLLSDGFGQTMGSIGIMVALGILLGKILADAGATEQIARLFLHNIGTRFSLLACYHRLCSVYSCISHGCFHCIYAAASGSV